MPPSLSELKVTPSFYFPFKIPDNLTATTDHQPIKKLENLQKRTSICSNFKAEIYFGGDFWLSTENITRFFFSQTKGSVFQY